jgi:hypothetical protein
MATTSKFQPKFPIYVPSKGRWEARKTQKALERMGIETYFVIVEQFQYDNYAAVIDPKHLLVLPQIWLDLYNTFDDEGTKLSKGPGAARNFAWWHSVKEMKATWHWVIDDNQDDFMILNRGSKIRIETGAFFSQMEWFVDHFENVGMAGPNYDFFAPANERLTPFMTNTRIFSCNLIKNSVAFEIGGSDGVSGMGSDGSGPWRGRYSEDVCISLRILKANYATIQFNHYLQGKEPTVNLAKGGDAAFAKAAAQGGNRTDFYTVKGVMTNKKSEMAVAMHPDCVSLIDRYDRCHHWIDYSKVPSPLLIRKKNYTPGPFPKKKLVQITPDDAYPDGVWRQKY